MSLIDVLTAVFGKAKYDDGNVTVFSPDKMGELATNIENMKEDSNYHWRTKENCVACNKHRVVMQVPHYGDFGHYSTVFICANCAKDMYGISRYLFNTRVLAQKDSELPW